MKPLAWLGLDRLRRRLASDARGSTFEIGAGTGLNLLHYDRTASPLIALDVERDGLLAQGGDVIVSPLPQHEVEVERHSPRGGNRRVRLSRGIAA